MLECDDCGGPLLYMGRLATTEWYRCQACGAEQWYRYDEETAEGDRDD